MKVSIEFALRNADLMRSGYLGARARPATFVGSVVFFVVLPWACAMLALVAKGFGYPVTWLPIAVLVVVPVVTVVFFAFLPVILFRGSPALRGSQRYEFTETEIHAVGPGFDTKVKWDVLTHFLLHPFGLLLLSGKAPFVTVPGRALSSTSRQELLALLAAKGLKRIGNPSQVA